MASSSPTPIVLFPYQEPAMPHLQKLVDENKPLVLMAASTGFGKTVMALELMRRTGKKFGVVAPRATLSSWTGMAAKIGVSPEFVVNVEAIRTGNKKHARILEKLSNYSWIWRGLDPGSFLIVDEVHRHGGLETQNAYLVANARKQGINVVALSATIGDSPLKLRLLLYLAGKVPWQQYYQWARDHGCYRDDNINGHPWRFLRGAKARQIMEDLNSEFFPEFGVRLRSEDIPGFPKVQNIVDLVTPSDEARRAVKEAYSTMAQELKNPNGAANELVRMLRWRQRIEEEKLPVFKELVEEALEEGMSVVASFNFTAPLFKFAEAMKAHSPALIYGSDPEGRMQTSAERDEHKRRFQSNETKLCLLTIQAGGVGLSLGDELGGHPRIAFHNLPLDSTSLVQLIGRIHRADSKTPSINRIVLLDGVAIEERVFKLLAGKVANLSALQDDALDLTKLVN